jgi:hypothetical protein
MLERNLRTTEETETGDKEMTVGQAREIFGIKPGEHLTEEDIKRRYYELVMNRLNSGGLTKSDQEQLDRAHYLLKKEILRQGI